MLYCSTKVSSKVVTNDDIAVFGERVQKEEKKNEAGNKPIRYRHLLPVRV